MAIYHVYIYTFAILVYKSNAKNIDDGDMCLESASNFWNLGVDSRCNLTESEIKNVLQNANTTCPKMCKFTMSNKNSNRSPRGLKIKLIFNDRNKTELEACTNEKKENQFRELYINCSSWNKGEYEIYESGFASDCQDSNGQCDRIKNVCACHCQPGYTMVDNNCKKSMSSNLKVNEKCESDTQCTGTDNSKNCSGGICVCQVGYVSIKNTCHQGNVALRHTCVSNVQCTGTPLATNCSAGRCTCQVGHVLENNACYPGYLTLNQSCTYDSQCLGSPYASCVEGKCSCIKGYSAKDSSVCESMNERQEHRADDNKKSMFAAIIGGLLAGVVTVTVSAFLIYKRFCRNNTTRKEPVIRFENHHYDTKRVKGNATPLRETKQENVATKSPHDHSEEAVDYSHIYDETRDALTQDDVYHHLNEEEQKQDDNNYDHASAAVGHVTNLNEYNLISDFKNDKTVSATEEQDEYFVLEQSFSKDG